MTSALLTFCLLGIGQGPVEDRQALDQVREQARLFAKAYQAEDHAKVAEMTYPKWSEKIGSPSRLIQFWKKKIDASRNQGNRLESYEIDAPLPLSKADTDWLSVVPTTLKYQTVEGTASQKSFLVALSHDQGKTWHFIDGADRDAVKQLKNWVTKLPESFALPEPAKLRVEKAAKRVVTSSVAGNFKVGYPSAWEQSARTGNVGNLTVEKGEDFVFFFAEVGHISLDEVVKMYTDGIGRGKPRRLYGHKNVIVAGEKAKYFRYEESTDQELKQFHACVFNHQGINYRVIGVRRDGDAKEFEQDYFSMLERFAFLNDRTSWLRQYEGVPKKTVLLGGLGSFELPRPRWTEDTFDTNLDNQHQVLDHATFRFTPGGAFLNVWVNDSQGDAATELAQTLAVYSRGMQGFTSKPVTFTTKKGKWPGQESQGILAGLPRIVWMTCIIKDGITIRVGMETQPHQADEARQDWDALLDSLTLQSQSKPDQPLAFPIRRNPSGQSVDTSVAEVLKKATQLYPGNKAYEILRFSPDGKQALINSQGYFLEDLATKKRQTLTINGLAPYNFALSADRQWVAYQTNDEITVYPLGFGFTKKIRIPTSVTMFGFGPNSNELLAIVSGQKPSNQFDRGNLSWYSTQRLEKFPLDNRPKQAVLDWPLIRVSHFALSPDGKKLAVVANRDYPRTHAFGGYLYLCKPDGTDLKLLNKDPADYRSLGWSGDGKSIYALRRVSPGKDGAVGPGGMQEIERISAETGEAVQLTNCGRINFLWTGGENLFFRIQDSLLPTSQQGVFRVNPDDLAKASAQPKPKIQTREDLAEKIAQRLQKSLGKTPVRQFVPTPESMQLLVQEFADAVKQETGLELEANLASVERLKGFIDQLELASGKHPVNVLGVGAYYGETLRKLLGASWQIKPVPFGEWLPNRNPLANNVAEIVLPFSDTYRWAMFDGSLIDSYALQTRPRDRDWLLVYPPSHVDEVMKLRYKDYQQAKQLLDRGEIDAALELLKSEVTKRPKNAQLAREVVGICNAVNRPALAKTYVKQAVEAGIEANDLLMLYADELVRTEPGKALEYYRKAAQSTYVVPEALIKLGRAYERAGQLPLAESCWRRAYFPATDLQRNEIRQLMGSPIGKSNFLLDGQ